MPDSPDIETRPGPRPGLRIVSGRLTAADMAELEADAVPFVANLGIRFIEVGDGHATAIMPAGDSHRRPGGTVAGPALMALADFVVYICVLGRIGRVELAVTTSLTANFLRRPPLGEVRAEGRLLKCGRRLAYGEVSLFAADDADPVCHVTATYSIPPDRPG